MNNKQFLPCSISLSWWVPHVLRRRYLLFRLFHHFYEEDSTLAKPSHWPWPRGGNHFLCKITQIHHRNALKAFALCRSIEEASGQSLAIWNRTSGTKLDALGLKRAIPKNINHVLIIISKAVEMNHLENSWVKDQILPLLWWHAISA